MKTLNWKFYISAAFAIVLVACGKPKEENNTVPTPTTTSTQTQTLTTTDTSTGTDSRIPDLTGAVAINLTDKVNYTGLQDLAHTLFLPIVGDAKVKMSFTNGRDTSVNGKVLIAFEDREGFWGAELPTFDGTSYRTTNSIDFIFADEEFVVRAVGAVSGDNINGSLYYRLRQPGDTQCRKVVITCDYYGYPPFPPCNTNIDTVTPCRQYMNIGTASSSNPVKSLGTFSAKYSAWATLQGE